MTMFPILLVEDDENDAFFFMRAARKAELSNPVHLVSDGREALAYIAGDGKFSDRASYPLPGLIVLDLNLPKKNGLEVLRWIRQHSSMPAMPVILLTSSTSELDLA